MHVNMCHTHCLLLEVLRYIAYIALNAFNRVHTKIKQYQRCRRYATDFNALNAMYVKDVKDGVCSFYATLSYSFCYSCWRCQRCQILWIIGQRLKIHTNIFLLITSLIFKVIFNPKKFLESWDLGLSSHTIKSYVSWSMLKMSEIIFDIFNML